MVRHTPYPMEKHGKNYTILSAWLFFVTMSKNLTVRVRESRKKLSNKQQFDYKRRGIEEVMVDEEKWGGVEENWKEISAIPFFLLVVLLLLLVIGKPFKLNIEPAPAAAVEEAK